MTDVLKPDLCVIGAGSGGLSVAAIAASFGVPVVLIERDRMGGDCLNVGCVPSKALIAAGQLARDMREAGRFGLERADPQVDMARVRDHVRGVIDAIAPNDSAERFAALGVRCHQGRGAVHRCAQCRGRRLRHPRPPLRARHGIAALGAADPGARRGALPDERDRFRPLGATASG